MSRFSFGIFGQDTNELISGQPIAIKSTDGNTLYAHTNGNANLLIHDNNDGTYYVDNLPTGLYSVFVNDIKQDELDNIAIVADDVITHVGEAAKHREINDAGTGVTDLLSANKITSDLAGKAASNHNHDDAYSALGHNHEGEYAAPNHNHSGVYAEEEVVQGLSATVNGKADSNHNHDNDYMPLQPFFARLQERTTHLDTIQDNVGKLYYYCTRGDQPSGTSGLYIIVTKHISGQGSTIERLALGEFSWSPA